MYLERYYTEHLNPQARQFAQILARQASMGAQALYSLGLASDPAHALDDALRAAQAVKCDYPQYFWLGHSWHARYELRRGRCHVELYDEYAYPNAGCLPLVRAARREAVRVAAQIYSRSNTLPEREERLFDYLYNIPYCDPDRPQGHNLLGVLLDRAAVCEGKSMAFCYLARQMGLPAMVVYGMGKGRPHAWNCVQLNGRLLQLDCTWGTPYFNRAACQMAGTHTPDPKFPLPTSEKEVSHGTLHTGKNPSARWFRSGSAAPQCSAG